MTWDCGSSDWKSKTEKWIYLRSFPTGELKSTQMIVTILDIDTGTSPDAYLNIKILEWERDATDPIIVYNNDMIIGEGESEIFSQKYTWKFEVLEVLTGFPTPAVNGQICFEEEVVPCSEHTTQSSCEDANCYWYDGACHRAPKPVPCSDHTTQSSCEAAGCYWYNDECHGEPEGITCAEYDTQDACIAAGCSWYDGVCHPKAGEGGAYELPLYGSVNVFGHEFENTELRCDIAAAIIRPKGLPAKLLVVGGAGTIFAVGSLLLPGSIFTTGVIMGGIYVSLKAIDDACTEATYNIFNAAYTEADHDEVVQSIIDELEESGLTVSTPEEPDPDADFTQAEIDKAATEAEEIVKNSDEEQERQEAVVNGEKTPEESDAERIAHITAETYRILYENKLTLKLPSVAMAGDIEVSGLAPLPHIDVDIMVVKKLFGFTLPIDKVIDTFTSDEDNKYSGYINLDEFGSITLRSRVKKELFGIGMLDILASDVKSDKHTIWVLTPTVLFALIVAFGLLIEKKYNYIGIFSKKRRK